MRSISVRFAIAAVAGALFILAMIGMMNYHFLKAELLKDASIKAKLIEENAVNRIEEILAKTRESSASMKQQLLAEGFDKAHIASVLREALEKTPYYYGMTMAFEPGVLSSIPFSPYYYKHDGKILYKDVAKSKGYDYLHMEWYTTPKSAGRAKWSEPYFDEGGGDILMATYGNPVYVDGKFAGILTIDLSLAQMEHIISSIHILKSGYAFLLSKEHKILVHPDIKRIMQPYGADKRVVFDKITKEGENWLYFSQAGKTGLIIGVVLPENELFASLNRISLISIILAITGSILLIIVMFLISRRITKPLKEVIAVTQEISLGNFDKKITLPKQKDEIYELALSINRMQDAIKRYISDLKRATAKEERAQSELHVARQIQMGMLPEPLEANPFVQIAATLKPARAVGGDFYDYFYIDGKHLAFVVADVSGKGVPAAMFMAVTMSYIRAYGSSKKDPAQIVKRLNDTLAENNDAFMFVTLFLGVMEVESGKVTYVNAGHTSPYIVSPSTGVQKLPESKDPVVGAFEGVVYSNETLTLAKGETLVAYTDGVTEAFSNGDEQFGEARLERLLAQHKDAPASALPALVEEEVARFCTDAEQSDDITLLAVTKA